NKDKITVQGIIKLVGSEPFTKLIIQTSDGNKYYLPDSLKNDTELFYKKVTLQGILKKKILKTADGKHKLEQLHLEDVKIISKE
ncbi:MAG: hypothetical protein KAT05_03535, partial [Spirochaetes bacterium]|nr:hypothetical protein [Spirochaetota bacterium]